MDMKKKVMVALGSALALTAMGGSAQAMTNGYGWDDGNGAVSYYVTDLNGENSLTESERERLENLHKADMQEQLAYLEKYGVSYDATNDTIWYGGKTVRWLIDEKEDDLYTAIRMPEGTIDLYTVRADDYQLTGVRVATQEEYDEKTNADQEAYLTEENGEVNGSIEADDGSILWITDAGSQMEEDGSVTYRLSDGSVIYSYSEAGDTAVNGATEYSLEIEPDQEIRSYVIMEGSAAADGELEEIETDVSGTDGAAWSAPERDSEVEEETAIESMAVAEPGTKEWKEHEDKVRQYENAGIGYDAESGCWTWNGKAIYWLMDEDGSMYTNGSEEAKKHKIYVIVKRSEDGTIEEAKQMTMEDLMVQQMLRDADVKAGE